MKTLFRKLQSASLETRTAHLLYLSPKQLIPTQKFPPLWLFQHRRHVSTQNDLYGVINKQIKNINKTVTYIFRVQLLWSYFWEQHACSSWEPVLKPKAKVARWSHRLFTSERYLVGAGPFNPIPPCPPSESTCCHEGVFWCFPSRKKKPCL